jgi:phosphoglycolate phosphatase
MSADLARLEGAAILFDLDGTLVDTAPDLVATLNWLLGEAGHPPLPIEDVRPMIGRGARWLIDRGFHAAGAPVPVDEMPPLFDRFIDRYVAHIADHSRPFPGCEDALKLLKSYGARLGVCTNKRTDLSVLLLDALNLSPLFEAVVGPDLAGAQKPDAAHLNYAIEAVGGALPHAVLVGDAATDAGAARAAGAHLILVPWGYTETPVDDLAPDRLIGHFDDLAGACAELL